MATSKLAALKKLAAKRYNPGQPRDATGRWASTGSTGKVTIKPAATKGIYDPGTYVVGVKTSSKLKEIRAKLKKATEEKVAVGEFTMPDPNAPRAKVELPDGVTTKQLDSGSTIYSFKIENQSVKVLIAQLENSRVVGFEVSGSYDLAKLSDREANTAAIKISRIMKHEASTVPDGTKYGTVAHIDDGYGDRRALAYNKISGFSIPDDGVAGSKQYGVVRNGRLVPDVKEVLAESTVGLKTMRLNWQGTVRGSANTRGKRRES